MKPTITRLYAKLDTSVWLIPALSMLGAALLSVLLEHLDQHVSEDANSWFLFRGGPEGARAVLATVAGSLMTLAGVVFSVTILVLQLASSQFSPRVLRHFLGDRGSQTVLGVFMGTFLYALLGLRSVRGSTDGIEDNVPALTVWFAVVLATGCVASFIYFIHHVAQSIRAVNLLHRIGQEAREHLPRLYPEALGERDEDANAPPERDEPSLVIPFQGTSGVLIAVDDLALAKETTRAGAVLRLCPMVGDFVLHGTALFEAWGEGASELDLDLVRRSVAIGRERNVRQDVLFAIRELVDVAERALSPGVNDPTTAIQALDEIHDILRRLVRQRFPDTHRYDEEGRLRLILPRPDWNAYVRLAVDEVRIAGAGSMQVARRLRFLLEDLLRIAPLARRAELQKQLAMLERNIRENFENQPDRAIAGHPSAQGHGPE